MRVTKLIRDYVTKTVEAKFPKTPEELKWENEGKRMNEAIQEAEEKIEAFVKKTVKELNSKYGFTEDYCLISDKRCPVRTNRFVGDSDMYKAYCKAQSERHGKIYNTIEEILVTLELGGTKADLDKMLNDIGN